MKLARIVAATVMLTFAAIAGCASYTIDPALDGLVGVDETCVLVNDCSSGLVCISPTPGATGLCLPICSPAGNSSCEPQFCVQSTSSQTDFCRAPCDPVNRAACSPGGACMPHTDGFYCDVAGRVAPGEACAAGSSCQRGYVCSGGKCLQWCRTDGTSFCDFGSCHQISAHPNFSGVEIGVCS